MATIDLENLLNEYDQLTEILSHLLKMEQANLKTGGRLEDTADVKKQVVSQLGDLNGLLKAYREDSGVVLESSKSRIADLQNKLMSILKLDRSVEKAFLSDSALRVQDLNLAPTASRVSQAYGRH